MIIMGGPPTPMQNRGTKTIDGIFVSRPLLPLISGGYLAFRAGLPSDHWLLWIDIPAAELSLDLVHHQTKSAARCLQCSNPWVVSKYLGNLQSWSQQLNWLPWIKKLCDGIHGNRLMHIQIQEYALLDCKISAGKLQAEQNCRKLKMNQVPWSPSLIKAIYWVLYWKGVLAKAKGHQIGISVLHS